MQVYNISFGANFIKNTTILQKDKSGNFKPYDVALVELDPYSKNDIATMAEIADEWFSWESFTPQILESMENISDRHQMIRSERKFYALTTQTDNFEKLDQMNILNTAQVSDYRFNQIKLDFIETNPAYKHKEAKSCYKHIGTAMLNCIKELYSKKDIYLRAIDDAVDFYLLNGFKRVSENLSEFVLKRGS